MQVTCWTLTRLSSLNNDPPVDRPPVDRRINLQTGPQCVLHVSWSQYLDELDGKGALSHSSSPNNHQFESFLVSTHFQSGPEPLRAHRRTSGAR